MKEELNLICPEYNVVSVIITKEYYVSFVIITDFFPLLRNYAQRKNFYGKTKLSRENIVNIKISRIYTKRWSRYVTSCVFANRRVLQCLRSWDFRYLMVDKMPCGLHVK